MRFILSALVVATVALSALTACQNAAGPGGNGNAARANTTSNMTPYPPGTNAAPKVDDHGHTDDAPRIALADAKKDFDAGNAVFIDTRVEATYKQEHVKGAINIPVEAVDAKFNEIPKGKKIIAYCS